MREVNLMAMSYEEFLKVMNVLKDNCNDLDIRNGLVRQRSNDRASIFEINISHLIDDITMSISDLKRNIDLLKVFERQDVDILIDSDNGGDFFQFSDQYSSIKFRPIIYDYIDNKFMTEEELEQTFVLENSDIILSSLIPKSISDRIKIISSNFNVNSIQVKFNGETVSLTAETQSKSQMAKFYDGLVSERLMNAETSIVTIPFLIDHDSDISLQMYNVRDNIIICKFDTSILNSNVTIYTRSSLVMNEETESNTED